MTTPTAAPTSVGRAPANRLFPVPVRVEGPGGVRVSGAALTVEVSFDDGESWRRVPLLPGIGYRHALVPHPPRSGYVSLRATVDTPAGTRTELTVIRAYQTSWGG